MSLPRFNVLQADLWPGLPPQYAAPCTAVAIRISRSHAAAQRVALLWFRGPAEVESTMLLLEISVIVLSVLAFALFDFYVRRCERI